MTHAILSKRTLLIGETVKWYKHTKLCTGIVRDDLDSYIVVLCIDIGGDKCCKKKKIKKDILITKEQEKMDVRRVLLQNRFKKMTKIQLLEQVKNGGLSELEQEVITEILITKGTTNAELEAYDLEVPEVDETPEQSDEDIEDINESIQVEGTDKEDEDGIVDEESGAIIPNEGETVKDGKIIELSVEEKEEKVVYEDPLTEEEIELQKKQEEQRKKNEEKKKPVKIEVSKPVEVREEVKKRVNKNKGSKKVHFTEDAVQLINGEDVLQKVENKNKQIYSDLESGISLKIQTSRRDIDGVLKYIFYGKHEKDIVLVIDRGSEKQKRVKVNSIKNLEIIKNA